MCVCVFFDINLKIIIFNTNREKVLMIRLKKKNKKIFSSYKNCVLCVQKSYKTLILNMNKKKK